MSEHLGGELIVAQSGQIEKWTGAAERGIRARDERQQIIEAVLVSGTDFGVIPGTDKPCLFKSGAEKVVDALNLYACYEPLVQNEDFERPLFYYRYRCELRQRGSEVTVATGIGSCNSYESRYRWRQGERTCPNCGKSTIIKGKAEYGGGWLCFAKKGGCNAKWADGAAAIEGQHVERVENDDIFSLVNTIDKMAQKRALVAASLNLGFSERFTQDVEDLRQADNGRGTSAPTKAAEIQPPRRASERDATPERSSDAAVISESQRKRAFAIYRKAGHDDATVKEWLFAKYGVDSSRNIKRDDYEAICARFEDATSLTEDLIIDADADMRDDARE